MSAGQLGESLALPGSEYTLVRFLVKEENKGCIPPGRAKAGIGTYYIPPDDVALAEYTGFADVTKMMEFLLSPIMIEIAMQIEKEGLSNFEDWTRVFNQIRTRIMLSINYGVCTILDYWGEHIDLHTKFPDHGGSPFQVYHLSGWIWRLKERIEKYQRQLVDHVGSFDEATRHAFLVKTFNTTSLAKKAEIPIIDIATMCFPVLGPDYERFEDFMEPYNRVYYLWRRLVRLTASLQSLTFDSPDILHSKAILEEQSTEIEPSVEDEILYYKLSAKLDFPQQKTELALKKKALRPVYFKAKGWSELKPWQLRDVIRIKFCLASHQLQLYELKYVIVYENHNKEVIDLCGTSWDPRFPTILDNPHIKESYFDIGLRLLREGEKIVEDESTAVGIFYEL
ncbi:hypothetical protein F5884DRAFT_392647 [Xylogone sp. PMI_703]|nr:hypothetical protein F5884DRAFT_392647 [Xylogone sp. PMI_703]